MSAADSRDLPPEDLTHPAALPLRVSLVLNAVLIVFIWSVYRMTAAPSAWWGDGLELTCAARTLGIAHPTGYPLFIWTGHLALLLFEGIDPGRVMTLLGAAWIALSIPFLVRVLRDAMSWHELRGEMLALGLVGAMLLSRTLWEHATFVEVYPLTFLLCSLILYQCLFFSKRKRLNLRAAILGLSCGLAMLNHYSVLALVPLVAVTLWQGGGEGRTRLRLYGLATLCFLVGLCGYLYLPLRAAANPLLNWGDPSNLERLLWVLRGGQFGQVHVAMNQSSPVEGLGRWLAWWAEQWLPLATGMYQSLSPLVVTLGFLLVCGATAGLYLLSRRQWATGWGLIGSLAATAFFAMAYRIPDIDAYFMPALPAFVIGWCEVCAALTRRSRALQRARIFVIALPAILVLWPLAIQWRVADKNWDDGPAVWGEALMENLPERAVLLTVGDNDTYTAWYEQMALEHRPDVTVCGTGFIFSGWYARYFEARPGQPPITIAERGIAENKLFFDVALLHDVILPSLRDGRRVFLTQTYPTDRVTQEILRPRVVATNLLPRNYPRQTTYEPVLLPSPVLYELQVPEALWQLDVTALYHRLADIFNPTAMQRQALYKKFIAWYHPSD